MSRDAASSLYELRAARRDRNLALGTCAIWGIALLLGLFAALPLAFSILSLAALTICTVWASTAHEKFDRLRCETDPSPEAGQKTMPQASISILVAVIGAAAVIIAAIVGK